MKYREIAKSYYPNSAARFATSVLRCVHLQQRIFGLTTLLNRGHGIALILFICLAMKGVAQPTFYAHVDDEKVYKGTFFKVEYQLSDARGTGFKPPSFDKFKVAAGPARSFQTTVVNGKVNSFESYSYTLQAIQEGDYVIPPATIMVNGKTLKTNPVHMSVLPPLKQGDLLKEGAPTGQDYFLVAEINRDTAYAGQQILLDYRIFTKKNIEKVDFKQLPDLSEFHWMGLYLVNENIEQVTISDEVYSTKLIKRFAIFPKRPGTYNIDPAQLLIMIPMAQKRGFFFNNYETKYINSNALKLSVLPLPDDAPDNYSGMVGSYTMESGSGPKTLTTDDAVTVRMRVKGNGDANRFTIPKIKASKELEVYEPKIISKNNDQNQKKRDHFAVIEYLFTASKPGPYFVKPEFVYFDVDSNDYVTLSADSFLFDISKGSGQLREVSPDTAIQYELVAATAAYPGVSFVRQSIWQLTWVAFFIVAILLSLLRYIKNKRRLSAPPKTRHELAMEQLAHLKNQNDTEVAHRIEEILGDFFRDELDIEESAWSINELQSQLNERGYAKEGISQLVDLLNTCEFAAYSGMQSAQQIEWVERAMEILGRFDTVANNS